jgi:hypothetical protein
MSNFPIQESAADQLSGGQKPLSNDDNRKSTHGGTFNQDTMNFCRGENVTPGSAGPIAPAPHNREAASVNQMAVAAPVAVGVKPVDRKTLEGSTPGDFRVHGDYAKAALDRASDNGGPRQPVGQFPLSGRTPAPSTAQSFPGNLTDSDSGN